MTYVFGGTLNPAQLLNSRTTWVSQYQKGKKTILDFLKQR